MAVASPAVAEPLTRAEPAAVSGAPVSDMSAAADPSGQPLVIVTVTAPALDGPLRQPR